MHLIELIGSYTTVTDLGGEEIRITTQRKDPVPILCREMITRGANPLDTAHVTRGGSPVWRRDRTLAAWAGIDIVEEDRAGLRTRTHRPLAEATWLPYELCK